MNKQILHDKIYTARKSHRPTCGGWIKKGDKYLRMVWKIRCKNGKILYRVEKYLEPKPPFQET
jgi:hypothetical protein